MTGPDIFVALAAVAWADGELDADEADAIVRAAADEGLPLEEIARIEKATSERIDLAETLDRSGMSKEDRLFVYAVAAWIARLDGQVTLEESDVLSSLAERLGVPDRLRARVEVLVDEVARMPEGDRPLRYNLARLRELIGARVAAPGPVSSSPVSTS